MAGFYPDVPAPRMAYDEDGTIGLVVGHPAWTGAVTALDAASMRSANSEDLTSLIGRGNASNLGMILIFPEFRDVVAVSMRHSSSNGTLQWSNDTTDGIDGTWHSVVGGVVRANSKVQMRENIVEVNLSEVIAIRWNMTGGNGSSHAIYGMHVYGYPSSGQNLDSLRLWHPTLDEEILDGAYFDWGDVRQETTQIRQFRIKNISTSLEAQGVAIEIDAPTDEGAQTIVDAHSLSADGVLYSNYIELGSIAPNTISPVLNLRYAPSTLAVAGVRVARLLVKVDEWI